MKKKIAIGSVVFLVAIFAIAYAALHFMQQELSQRLKQHHIQFQQWELTFFPLPYVSLHQVHWTDTKQRKFEAQKINLQLDFRSLLNLANSNKKLSIEQAKIWHSGQPEPDFQNVNAQIEGEIWLDKSAVNLANFSAHIQLDKPILLNTTDIQLQIATGQVQLLASQYQGHFHQVQLNEVFFPEVRTNIEWLATQQSVRLEMQQQNAPTSQLTLQMQSSAAHQVQFQARQLMVQQWEKLLNLPHLLTGVADGKGNLRLHENKAVQGNVQIKILDGELQGFNLLQMIEGYIPVKLNHTNRNSKKGTTEFKQLSADLAWDAQQFDLKQLTLQNSAIVVKGRGVANLHNFQCDIHLNVGLAHSDWQHLNLPMQFFDHCYAPKYKIGFDKNLRQGLKDLLKAKFR